MHLLEAALAWEQIAPAGPWRRLADEVVELCLTRFIAPRHGGALLEYFDATWMPAAGAPAAGGKGDAIWPGHQFEWAGLLERWALARGRDDVRTVARHLYDIGMRHGIDAERGVAVFELAGDFSVREPRTRLWVQTEWLKAALILARSENDPERRRGYLGDAVAAARALTLFLDLPVRGLWRDKFLADGTWIDEPAPASSFYHIIDALRVLAQSPAV
jgi:mannose-6-phosphate isomerase